MAGGLTIGAAPASASRCPQPAGPPVADPVAKIKGDAEEAAVEAARRKAEEAQLEEDRRDEQAAAVRAAEVAQLPGLQEELAQVCAKLLDATSAVDTATKEDGAARSLLDQVIDAAPAELKAAQREVVAQRSA